MLGATGAHYLDALRWWFGEVKAVAGAVSTMVRQRRLPDSSAMAKVDADDNFAVILRFASGALGTIHVSATAGHEGDEEVTLSGSEGTFKSARDASGPPAAASSASASCRCRERLSEA